MTMPQRLMLRRRTIMAAGLVSAASVAMMGPAHAQELAQVFSAHEAGSKATIDHTPWAEILKAYLRASPDGINRFAYGKVTAADKAKLKAYLEALQAVKVSSLDRPEQRAYWSNLYNALTIDVVLDAYPVASIRDISSGFFTFLPGPWSKQRVTVEGKFISLDDIEHKILRKIWRDPLNHYAVNCASIGCPNLMKAPFTGATIDAMLKQGAPDYINHPRGVTVMADGRIKASNIYSWFSEDFGRNDAEIIAHFKQYAKPELLAKLNAATSIASYDYDWTLNEAK
jgi:hypothetical protein